MLDGVETPDQAFDRSWARTILRQSIDEIRTTLTEAGRESCFQVFERYELSSDSSASYEDVASELSLTRAQVKAYLTYTRLLLKRTLRSYVAETVVTEEDLYRELKELFES